MNDHITNPIHPEELMDILIKWVPGETKCSLSE